MRKLDWYILKKFLSSFGLILLLLLPIAIAIDVSEKVDKFLRFPELTLTQIVEEYYVNFIVIYGNTFMPLALFIAVIFFTSKLASNTEVIAIHCANISFTRFLYPYFIGATIVATFALMMNHFVVPKSNKTFNEFSQTYIKKKKFNENQIQDVNLQISPDEYIYIKTYTIDRKVGYRFTYEKFEGTQLKFKLRADNIRWIERDTTFTLVNWNKRTLLKDRDLISNGAKMDTLMNFMPKDLVNVDNMAKEMNSVDLYQYINQAKNRGVSNLNNYLVELYKRTSLPMASFILTLLAVSLSSRKKRGGIGINLAMGITLMFIYVFFLKIAEVLGAGADVNSLFVVWLPNLVFGALATYLYIQNANN